MQYLIEQIRLFNHERRLLSKPFNLGNEMAFLLEELSEFSKAKTDSDRIDALADLVVFAVGIGLKTNCSITLKNPISYSVLQIKGLRSRLIRITAEFNDGFNEKSLNSNSEYLRVYLNQLLAAIRSLGYDPEKVLTEVCRHINSESGGYYDEISGKYIKGERTYFPNYEDCKIEIEKPINLSN